MNHRTYTGTAFVFCALLFGAETLSMNLLLNHPTRKETKNRKTIRPIKAPKWFSEKDCGYTGTLNFRIDANCIDGRYWHEHMYVPIITQPKMADHLKKIILDEITRCDIQTPVSFYGMSMVFAGNDILNKGDKFLCDFVRDRYVQGEWIMVMGSRPRKIK
jgi:hypothetical protein